MKISDGQIGAYEMIEDTIKCRDNLRRLFLIRLFLIGKKANGYGDEREKAFSYASMMEIRHAIAHLNEIIVTLKEANGIFVRSKDRELPDVDAGDYKNNLGDDSASAVEMRE